MNENTSPDKNNNNLYTVHFVDAILHHSFAAPLPDNHKHKHTELSINIQVNVYHHQVQALLHVDYVLITDEKTQTGYGLNFSILGKLKASDNMPQDELANYAKIHSLAFLWPYAREYNSDLIRRMSINAPSLPIINPQTMTKALVEEGLIELDILGNLPENN